MVRLFGPRYGRFRNLAWLFLAVAVILFVLAFLGIVGFAVLQPFIILFVILFVIVLVVSFL